MRNLLLACLVVGTTACANAAQTIPVADPGAANRVLVQISASGDTTAPQLARFRVSVASALQRSGWTVVPEQEVAKKAAQIPELIGCETDACLRKLARLVGAQWATAVTFHTVGPMLRIHMVGMAEDGSGNRVDRSDTCMACTLDEALESASNIASELKTDLETASSKSKSSAPAKVSPAKNSD
jgi:hypothetical protein